ncbi:protein TPR1-like isoform X2 [Camellia sinensis]|uniref:protein TPR1-like isoform X2 n=1 Tax=Camellia sinensis TaxID=4442 RepID=UPI001036AFBE|nr:protein TPR1-like isoform X2 [Camellia sinensis]
MVCGFGCIQGSKCIRTTHCDKGTKVTYPTSRQHATWSLDDLPRTVACTMHQGSAVNSMDFHPSHHTLLLVGFATGEITLWEVGMRYKLVSKPFKIWDMANCYMLLQVSQGTSKPSLGEICEKQSRF